MTTPAAPWDEIRRLLREARKDVAPERGDQSPSPVPVGPLSGTLDEFDEFLDHNELELAWDALGAVAESVNAPPATWRKLAKAAGLMHLPAKEDLAAQRAAPRISYDQALTIARLDADKAYPNVLSYRITIVLEPDGWHVDYDLRDPELHGGGPHYVIDPDSGAIVSKRYEQ
jgi:hypothetical protein